MNKFFSFFGDDLPSGLNASPRTLVRTHTRGGGFPAASKYTIRLSSLLPETIFSRSASLSKTRSQLSREPSGRYAIEPKGSAKPSHPPATSSSLVLRNLSQSPENSKNSPLPTSSFKSSPERIASKASSMASAATLADSGKAIKRRRQIPCGKLATTSRFKACRDPLHADFQK